MNFVDFRDYFCDSMFDMRYHGLELTPKFQAFLEHLDSLPNSDDATQKIATYVLEKDLFSDRNFQLAVNLCIMKFTIVEIADVRDDTLPKMVMRLIQRPDLQRNACLLEGARCLHQKFPAAEIK